MRKTKECFRCHKPKPLTDFYAHSKMANGCLGKCKECTKKDVKENYLKNQEHYRQYDKLRNQLPHRIKMRVLYAATKKGLEAGNQAKRAWELRNPEKKRASTTLSNAVRDGKIFRAYKCAICGSTKNIEAHHEDYTKPLEIVELCKKHHWEADEKRRLRNVISC